MGNIILPDGMSNEADIGSEESTKNVRIAGSITYGIGALLFLCLIVAFVGIRELKLFKSHFIGIILILGLFGLNGYMAWQETIGSYGHEKAEASALGRDAFYLVAAVFSLTTMMHAMQPALVRSLLPKLMLAVFFGIVMVLAPVWVSTVESTPTIMVKHIKTAFMLCGMGFLTMALTQGFITVGKPVSIAAKKKNAGNPIKPKATII